MSGNRTETQSEPQDGTGSIATVAAGMRVIDAAGVGVGRVIGVELGDPNAVAAQDPPDGDGILGDRVPHTEEGDEPEVPPDIAARLLRTGYLRIGAEGLRSDDLYVAADQIAGVAPDGVTLTVTRDRLTPRS